MMLNSAQLTASASAIVGFAALTAAAKAEELPRWIVRAGLHPVQLERSARPALALENGAALTFDVTYLVTPRWGVELFAAAPVEHDLRARDAGDVGRVRELPSVLSIQRHFLDPNGGVRAYVGVGVNYMTFFDERTRGALAGSTLQVDPSWGPAVQLGLDLDLSARWLVNIDARWLGIDANVRINGAEAGRFELDALAFGMSIGRRFR